MTILGRLFGMGSKTQLLDSTQARQKTFAEECREKVVQEENHILDRAVRCAVDSIMIRIQKEVELCRPLLELSSTIIIENEVSPQLEKEERSKFKEVLKRIEYRFMTSIANEIKKKNFEVEVRCIHDRYLIKIKWR